MRYFLYNVRKVIRLILFWGIRLLTFWIPKDPRLIVFGSWLGNYYCDNPKWFMLHVLKRGGFKCIWIGKKSVKGILPICEDLKFAEQGSFSAAISLARAGTWVCCQSIDDDLSMMPWGGEKHLMINFWHGIPIKYIGALTPFNKVNPWINKFGDCVLRCASLPPAWHSASSRVQSEVMPKDAPLLFSKDKMLYSGTPRNDFLIKNLDNSEIKMVLKRKYSSLLGFNSDQKIVLYLPTWRRGTANVKSFYNLDDKSAMPWNAMLSKHNAVLIEKHHYRTYEENPITRTSFCSIVIPAAMQAKIDVQELLLITDVLISDYSGAYIDFGVMKRPIIHFAYDLEDYKSKDSGLIYDFEQVVAGPIVTTFEALRSEVEAALISPTFKPAKEFSAVIEFEKGHACEDALEFIRKHHKIG